MNNAISFTNTAVIGRLVIACIVVCCGFFLASAHALNCSTFAEWNSASIYTNGMQVKQSGKGYKANWWTQGKSPAAYSGQWQEWTLLGNCDDVNSSSVKSSSSTSAAKSSINYSVSSSKISSNSSSSASNDCGSAWYRANLTHYESYPAPGSDECVVYNGCTWSGWFYGLPDQKPESWVMANNIAAVHLKDWNWLGSKTLNLRQGSRKITAKVYDACADSDCAGCCTANLAGDGYLIDLEKYTKERFGSGSGIVEFQVCN